MKLVGILGSPHGMEGATGPLLRAVLDATGGEVELFCLRDLAVTPCMGCDVCHKVGRCAIRDDFHRVLEALVGADGFVLASPNYITSVSAQMKALFDRCCGPLHIQLLEGKYGAAVVTSGGDESPEVEAYMLRFVTTLGCTAVGSVGAAARELQEAEASAAVLERAAALGTRLAEAIRTGERFPEQEPARAAFRARMQQLVRFRQDEWPYEYRWWVDRGLEA